MIFNFFVVELVVIVVLIGVYEWLMYLERTKHREEVERILEQAEKERKDLYSRIQSRDLSDYITHSTHKERVSKTPKNFLQQAKTEAYKQFEE